MRKIVGILAAIVLFAALLPAAALASDGHGGISFQGLFDFHGKQHGSSHESNQGTITAIGTDSFDLKLADGATVTVNVAASTRFVDPFGNQLQFSDLKVDDRALVKLENNADADDGQSGGAQTVVVLPPNTHPAAAKGTVTAVNSSSFNLQTRNGLVVTVNTDSNTTVSNKSSTSSTSTLADIQVGTRLSVRGLWDEILNVLRAIRIRFK